MNHYFLKSKISISLFLSTFLKNFCILVEALVEKYGQGEVYVRKCKTCEFEQTVRTAGCMLMVTKVQ